MANKTEKATQNVAGSYYVDSSCIACGQCLDLAGDFFVETADGICVTKQPVTPDEIALCEQAIETCPVNAIGNDG